MERTVTVSRETGWLEGQLRFPGELRLPAATTIAVSSRTGLKDKSRFDTRYFIASAELTAERAAHAVRGHWLVENALHWTLDVVFNDDQSRLRKGHGALNMAIVRHFALNLVRAVSDRHSSNSDAKRPAEIRTTSPQPWESYAVNLDSEPCSKRRDVPNRQCDGQP